MDYIDAFKNLKTNRKYIRKSPHKAVLLLSVIKLFEEGKIINNEIKYDTKLKVAFNVIWNRLLPNEPLFHSGAYSPFWYLQNEDFWHVVPYRNKEDILNIMKDERLKPSEAKIEECVSYVELDDDLYFLMTIPSGREELKKVLLSTYFDLSDSEIMVISSSPSITAEYVPSPGELFKALTKQPEVKKEPKTIHVKEELKQKFLDLDEELRISLNIQYFTFLKKLKGERDTFLEVCPSIEYLYDRLTDHPLTISDVPYSFKFTYSNFLQDLRISLMSEENSFDLIDNISNAINVLEVFLPDINDSTYDTIDEVPITYEKPQEDSSLVPEFLVDHKEIIENDYNDGANSNGTLTPLKEYPSSRKGQPWTSDEEKEITNYYHQGYSFDEIAKAVGRTEIAIRARLNSLGLIQYEYNKEEANTPKKDKSILTSIPSKDVHTSFTVENLRNKCFIYDENGNRIYNSTGQLKIFDNLPFRICYTWSNFAINQLNYTEHNSFVTGKKILSAARRSNLFVMLNEDNYLDQIEDLKMDQTMGAYAVRVDGVWYTDRGEVLLDYETSVKSDNEDMEFVPLTSEQTDLDSNYEQDVFVNNKEDESLKEEVFDYEPKGKLSKIKEASTSTYDILWTMAIIDLEFYTNRQPYLTLDNISCMMIANAWELMNKNPMAMEKEEDLRECIDYLIEESKDNMDFGLSWESDKELIYDSIKDYPMAGVFEDTVEKLVEKAPFNILKVWNPTEDVYELVLDSKNFSKPYLYSYYSRKIDPYIEVNRKWQNNLYYEHDNLIKYFTIIYNDFVNGC